MSFVIMLRIVALVALLLQCLALLFGASPIGQSANVLVIFFTLIGISEIIGSWLNYQNEEQDKAMKKYFGTKEEDDEDR